MDLIPTISITTQNLINKAQTFMGKQYNEGSRACSKKKKGCWKREFLKNHLCNLISDHQGGPSWYQNHLHNRYSCKCQWHQSTLQHNDKKHNLNTVFTRVDNAKARNTEILATSSSQVNIVWNNTKIKRSVSKSWCPKLIQNRKLKISWQFLKFEKLV